MELYKDDQLRRDFTINALAISLNKQSFGELIDPFDGIKDMKGKMIRTPVDPVVTFSDDPLRMMRAARFASQLNYDIEPDTFSAMTSQAERLKIVSQERITDELNKIILSPVPSYGFKLLFHSGLLKLFFPELVLLHGVGTSAIAHIRIISFIRFRCSIMRQKYRMIYGYGGQRFYTTLPSLKPSVTIKITVGHSMVMKIKVHVWFRVFFAG